MGWWDKVKSAAKSLVNKAVSVVKKVVNTVKKTVSKVVKKVSSSVKKVYNTVKKTVSNVIKKVSSSVKKVYNTVKKTVSKVVNNVNNAVTNVKEVVKEKVDIEKVKDKIEDFKETAKIIASNIVNKVSDAVDKVKDVIKKEIVKKIERDKEIIDVITKKVSLLSKILKALIPTPFAGVTQAPILITAIYQSVTGKELTEIEWIKIQAEFIDWIVPLNALSKLFTGINIKGEKEEFGSVGDYADIVFALAMFIPAGKVGKVISKLGFKASTKLGTKGFIKFATTKIDDAAKLFMKLNVDDQAKLLGKLSKTDDGVKIMNRLIHRDALRKTLVRPTISIVNKKIAESILRGAGLTRFISFIAKPKTIIGSIIGLGSILSMAYGIAFGTSWMAKEGIKEQFEISLSDRMRKYRYDPTPEYLEIIRDDIAKLRELLPIAEAQIRSVKWLWPLTEPMWRAYADNMYFQIDQVEREIKLIVPPELIELPEEIQTTVRDIIDGDTIDTSLEGIDVATGKEIKLPQYAKTGHARIRIVGINAPEKSPKGEILCSDVEIFNVEKMFADESRDRLLPLNDKRITLKIDPEISVDTYGRILAVVVYNDVDIGLRQIEEGLACGYYREPHKYFDEDLYREETLKAKSEGIGMWKGLEEVEKEEDKIKIKITSTPTNAKLFLDDVALHHNTPSDEIELSDVLHLFTLGKHVLSAEKAGLSAMGDIVIVKGDNGTFHLELVTEPFPEVPTPEEIEVEEIEAELVEEKIEEVKIEEEIIEKVEEPVKPADIPKEYVDEQIWALKEGFAKVLELTEGKAIMSKKERERLFANFVFYTNIQKEVLKLLMQDIAFYTEGRAQLSGDEFILLQEKYRMLEV